MKRHRRYKNIFVYTPIKRGDAGIFPLMDMVEYPEVAAYVRQRGGGLRDYHADVYVVPCVADKLYLERRR